jgi:hypothetical protein
MVIPHQRFDNNWPGFQELIGTLVGVLDEGQSYPLAPCLVEPVNSIEQIQG